MNAARAFALADLIAALSKFFSTFVLGAVIAFAFTLLCALLRVGVALPFLESLASLMGLR